MNPIRTANVSARVNTASIAELQEAIDRIAGGSAKPRIHLPFGVSGIDSRIPGGGLAFGCTHEVAGGSADAVNGAVSALFVAGIAARTTGPVIWCLTRPDIFAPALQQAGLNLGRVIFVESDNEEGVLDSAETALRFGGVAVVVAEVVRLPMVASKRMQLAAEQTGAMGLIIRRWRRQSEATDLGLPTASVTRWRVSSLPSEPLPVPGVGRARWMIELLRSRAGECFDMTVGACDAGGRMCEVPTRQIFNDNASRLEWG